MLKKVILATAIAASMGSALAQAIIIREAPPPMRAERMPGPRHGYEWAPGHYAWRHGQYVWVQGHWMRERRGEHWVADRWERRGDHWEMIAGHWERGPRGRDMGNRGMGDRDRDGIPNRYDHDKDNDGVPNRFDNAPNNPNRR
jgi:hypothetical protein